MDDDRDLHEEILHIEAHIEELADVIEELSEVHSYFKSRYGCRWNLDLGNNHRSGSVRSYGLDWSACGCYRRDGRLWVKHEYFEETTTAMKAAEAHRAELISRMDLRVVGDGEVG